MQWDDDARRASSASDDSAIESSQGSQPDGPHRVEPTSLERRRRSSRSGSPISVDQPGEPSSHGIGDAELFKELADEGFRGPRYEIFRAELAAYAIPVLVRWVETGYIYRLCAERHRPVKWNELEREILRESREEREKIAVSVVARGMARFRERALVGGGWDPAGGASLTTYFMGALLLIFKDEYEIWAREQRQHLDYATLALDAEEDSPFLEAHGATPEEIAASNDRVDRYINSLHNPTDQAIVTLLVYNHLTHAEAGTQLGMTPGAVTMRVKRLREAYQRSAS